MLTRTTPNVAAGKFGSRAALGTYNRRSNRAIRVSNSTGEGDVIDARGLPKEQLMLQAVSPARFQVAALDGHAFAWYKPRGPAGPDALLAADPGVVQGWLQDEWALGSVSSWPESLSQLMGATAGAITHDAVLHKRLREIFGVLLTDEQLTRTLPGIQSTVQKYLASWAAKGQVLAFTEALPLAFDILMNQAMQLGWSDADIQKYAVVAEAWNQGFTPVVDPAPDSLFSKGMKAREELIVRYRESLSSPDLVPGSIPAVLRDTYGANAEECTDNLIMVIFAGFETIASLVANMLLHLAQNPAMLAELRDEHNRLASKYGGPALSLRYLKDMTYTDAVLAETLRVAQIVASVPRLATKAIDTPNAPKVPAGCPFSAAWAGMSLLDPVVKGDPEVYRPERWLKSHPEHPTLLAAVLSFLHDKLRPPKPDMYQHPFGYGTHGCVGFRIARAAAAAVAQEVALNYNFTAETNTDFSDFPTGGRPKNELPLTLEPLKA